MSGVGGLFKKAAAVESAPAATPAATGFKIGGGALGRTSGPAVEQGEVATPGGVQTPVAAATSPANISAAKSFGGFKIGGNNSASPALPVKQESGVEAASSPGSVTIPTPAPAPAGPLPGETPASQPQRTIPDDVSIEVKRFIANLDHLHTLAPEPELATSAIRSIMMELKSQPQYIKHIADEDVSVMIQMMRETMGTVRVVKEQKAAKRKATVKAGVQDVLDDLADLNF